MVTGKGMMGHAVVTGKCESHIVVTGNGIMRHTVVTGKGMMWHT